MTALLVPAGLLCIAAACYHGYLGETRLIGPSTFANHQAKLLVSAIWQFSTVTWVVSGIVIAASPWLFDEGTRPWGVAAACMPILYGVGANAWITRGRHFGWKILGGVTVLAMVGSVL